jgi:hypothetical protein
MITTLIIADFFSYGRWLWACGTTAVKGCFKGGPLGKNPPGPKSVDPPLDVIFIIL